MAQFTTEQRAAIAMTVAMEAATSRAAPHPVYPTEGKYTVAINNQSELAPLHTTIKDRDLCLGIRLLADNLTIADLEKMSEQLGQCETVHINSSNFPIESLRYILKKTKTSCKIHVAANYTNLSITDLDQLPDTLKVKLHASICMTGSHLPQPHFWFYILTPDREELVNIATREKMTKSIFLYQNVDLQRSLSTDAELLSAAEQ